MRLLCPKMPTSGIHRQRRLVRKILFLFAFSFPPWQVCQGHIQRAVTKSIHDPGHGQPSSASVSA
jgi:hypothetical protein